MFEESHDYVRAEIIAKLDDILARYDEDDRENEIQEAEDRGYEAGFDDGMNEASMYECECESEERCYNPAHKKRDDFIKVVADAICERPL